MDDIDRSLLRLLQQDATRAYASLAAAVGLSAGAVHQRVRKLRQSGVIRRTTITVEPRAVDKGITAFVQIDAGAWMGDAPTRARLEALAWVEEAHIVAGAASLLVKVRTATTEDLQGVLKRLHQIPGVRGTQTIVVLETLFERPLDVSRDRPRATPPAPARKRR